MRNFKMTLEYDGTHFNGWQVQNKSGRTVQGEIEKAASKIFKKKVRVAGSGRTDSGVHAIGQVANFKVATRMTSNEILKAYNSRIPRDIVILKSQEVPLNFHAQYNAKRKTYRYVILNRQERSAKDRNVCWHIPYPLNVSWMRQETKVLVGRKDFRSFMAMNVAERPTIKNKDTRRTIYRLRIFKKNDFIHIEIEADGFLYKMVRNIVGTLVKIGSGKLPKGSMKKILKSKDRSCAGDTAPAHGLCLMEVKY